MDSKTILVAAEYGAETRQPYVRLTWGKESGLLSPDEAREHALILLAAAEAAEADAFIVEFMQKKVGLQLAQAVMVLRDFREWRTEFNSRKKD